MFSLRVTDKFRRRSQPSTNLAEVQMNPQGLPLINRNPGLVPFSQGTRATIELRTRLKAPNGFNYNSF